MNLLASMENISTFRIDDIENGGVDSNCHNQGIGTALFFHFLTYVKDNCGEDTLVYRTGITHQPNDSIEIQDRRIRFWNKLGLPDKHKHTVGDCLAAMKSNDIDVDLNEHTKPVLTHK